MEAPPQVEPDEEYVSEEDADFAPDDKDYDDDPDDLAALVPEDGLTADKLRRAQVGGREPAAAPPPKPRSVEATLAAMKEEESAFLASGRRAQAKRPRPDATDFSWLVGVCNTRVAPSAGPRLTGPVRSVLAKAAARSALPDELGDGAALAATNDSATVDRPRKSARPAPSPDDVALAAKAKTTIAQTKAVYTEVVRYAGQSIKYVCLMSASP